MPMIGKIIKSLVFINHNSNIMICGQDIAMSIIKNRCVKAPYSDGRLISRYIKYNMPMHLAYIIKITRVIKHPITAYFATF
jgi:hypothetical protein